MTNPLEELKALVDAATPATIWNGTRYEVDRSDDGPGMPPKWCVGVNGVGHYPIARFYEKRDADAWIASVNIAKRLTDEAWESKAIRAMAESQAVDDEGPFPFLCDLLDFSGENKRVTVLRAAWRAALALPSRDGGQAVD